MVVPLETNALPHYDDSDNTTGCCPRFNPDGWDGRELRLEQKAFVRATTRSLMYVPLNMGRVFARVQKHIEVAEAYSPDNHIVLSRDLSAWRAEHLLSVSGIVPEEDAVTLTGEFVTRVFEGHYRNVKRWDEQMQALARVRGGVSGEVYFFYTTCPACAKAYEKNYVVGVARI